MGRTAELLEETYECDECEGAVHLGERCQTRNCTDYQEAEVFHGGDDILAYHLDDLGNEFFEWLLDLQEDGDCSDLLQPFRNDAAMELSIAGQPQHVRNAWCEWKASCYAATLTLVPEKNQYIHIPDPADGHDHCFEAEGSRFEGVYHVFRCSRRMTKDELDADVSDPETPWGKIQREYAIIPGVRMVETARHGGIVLTEEQQSQLPDELKEHGLFWEEDEMWVYPVHFFLSQKGTLSDEEKVLLEKVTRLIGESDMEFQGAPVYDF